VSGNDTVQSSADVIVSQADPQNHGATYQVASNFNCLDHLPGARPPGGRVSNYVTSREQGGPASVACGPALVYRQYFVPLESGDVGQLRGDVELLSRTPAAVEDGYVTDVGDQAFDWGQPDVVRVGVHREIDVTLGRAGRDFRIVEGQRVHQVFGAALWFGSHIMVSERTAAIGRTILSEVYRNTILAAWENSQLFPGRLGSRKCFLTLTGTGVFRNPLAFVADAISSCQQIIVDSGLDVYLVCWSKRSYRDMCPLVQAVVDATRGSVIDDSATDH
jgi:hypothetical protein